MALHPTHLSALCVSAERVGISQGGFGRWGDKLAVPNAACMPQPANPLTFAVSVGGAVVVTELRKSPLAPDVPGFHPRGGLVPGEKGCENGHTHTTRRQIIQDTILQSQGRREPPRIRPERRSGGAGMGESAEVQEPGRRSGCPLAEEDFAAP